MEVKNELVKLSGQGFINTLILSEHNLGKTAALNHLLGSMHNEWICFADLDMLFRPGWLEASWKINVSFPGCGMIGAQVVFPDWEEDKGNSAFRNLMMPDSRLLKKKRKAGWLRNTSAGGVSLRNAPDFTVTCCWIK